MVDGNALRISPVAVYDLREEDGIHLLPDGPPVSADELRELRLADQR